MSDRTLNKDAKSRIEELERERNELLQDKKRLDWLEVHKPLVHVFIINTYLVDLKRRDETFRAAIDVAMEAEHE